MIRVRISEYLCVNCLSCTIFERETNPDIRKLKGGGSRDHPLLACTTCSSKLNDTSTSMHLSLTKTMECCFERKQEETEHCLLRTQISCRYRLSSHSSSPDHLYTVVPRYGHYCVPSATSSSEVAVISIAPWRTEIRVINGVFCKSRLPFDAVVDFKSRSLKLQTSCCQFLSFELFFHLLFSTLYQKVFQRIYLSLPSRWKSASSSPSGTMAGSSQPIPPNTCPVSN